jgi:hypothetical protein
VSDDAAIPVRSAIDRTDGIDWIDWIGGTKADCPQPPDQAPAASEAAADATPVRTLSAGTGPRAVVLPDRHGCPIGPLLPADAPTSTPP